MAKSAVTTGPVTSVAPAYPKPSYAWFMVILLTVAYVLSFVDRYVLGLLVEPIKADLELSDTQMGLLLGPSFAVFYALMGLPLGAMVDRHRRTWIVAAGVALWSLATALSGLAKNFAQLFLARMGVGVGEAALSPCAMSLIADSFPEQRRAKPIALYSTALSLGAGLAALIGAAVIAWTQNAEDVLLPLVGSLRPWQLTLIIVGLPGLLLAPLLFLLREPARISQAGEVASRRRSFGETLRYLGARWRTFVSFVSIFCLMTIVGYSTQWGAATFARTWGWSAVEFGRALGVMFLVVGPITVNFAGWLSDRWFARGIIDAPLLVPAIGVPIMVISGVIWPLLPSGELALCVLAISMAGVALASATGVTALLNIIPADTRGRTVALYYMSISFFGLGFGPLTIGVLNDYVFGADNLRYSMALLPLIFGVPVLLLIPYIRRRYQEEYRAVKASTQAALNQE